MAPIFGAPPGARKSDRARQRCALCIASPLRAAHNRLMERRPDNVLAFPQARDAIELRHLRAFVAVAEELNFSRAADRLHMSQSALSRQISSLEKLIGCDLLRRTTHRVELTLAGEALLERTHRLLEDVNEAVARTQSVGGELAYRLTQYWAPVSPAPRTASRSRTPGRNRGAVRAVPAAAGDRGRARERGRRAAFRIGPTRPGRPRSCTCTAERTRSAPRTATEALIGALAAAAARRSSGPSTGSLPSIPSRPASRTPSAPTTG